MIDGNSERAIGRLEGKLDALADAVERGQDESKQGRARIYAELEQVRQEAARSRAEVESLKQQMADAAPIISDIKRWRERFIGMQMLVVFLAGSAGAAITTFWKWLSVKIGVQ
ncbi:DUF1515 family protein [Ensifer sesbaniae]|uniref:DUF1515 family protein n=1 Tax=Ensifer sesbaniae TaxID=1214071 RepID=UPI00156920AA|nr:DUF1515 family protein [Ensifer sesbaniae]NRQ13477.1 hypothetical protein [Ensifer sesbaniae]